MLSMSSLRRDVIDACKKYNCIGSWWSFNDNIPDTVKNELATKHNVTVNMILQECESHSQELYHENKPKQVDMYGYPDSKDWG